MRSFITTVVVSALVAFAVSRTQSVQAQTLTVIHNFTGGGDGGYPAAGLTIRAGGADNLYGTTYVEGSGLWGVVFNLQKVNSTWIYKPLYSFSGGTDGALPAARVVFSPSGTLYGTTVSGGMGSCAGGVGCGTVFNLRPPATAACKTLLCPWTETVLYRFTGGSDGGEPIGDLTFDNIGDIYGTTDLGGPFGYGTVYEISSGGEAVLYSFTDGADGAYPMSGVTFDQAGNLYGTTEQGGTYRWGTVFQLVPSGSGWVENTLHAFTGQGGDGCYPEGGLIFDQSGNLYGTTTWCGTYGYGMVFELSPDGSGGWTETVLYTWPTANTLGGPRASLTMDSVGSLYGTTNGDGTYYAGSVFKLTPYMGTWIYTDLHDFTGGSDGGNPISNVVMDAQGNLFGTAEHGGAYGWGVVWEITP